MQKIRLPKIVLFFVILFLYLPIAVLVVTSFSESRFGDLSATFSLKWYRALFQNREIWEALQNTLIVGTAATLLSTILGSLSAFALYRFRSRWQTLHYGLIYAPLVIPEVLMGMSLLLLFLSFSVPLSLATIILAHTTFCISYVAMVVLARLDNFDYAVIEAAEDLGADWLTIVVKVVLPILAPAILSGALLAFTISIDDYIVTSFVSGPGTSTLPIHVYGMIKYGATPIINALSTMILAVTFVFGIVTQYLTKESLA